MKSLYFLFIVLSLSCALTEGTSVESCTQPNAPCTLMRPCTKQEACLVRRAQGYCNEHNKCITLNEPCSSNPLNATAPDGRYIQTPAGTIVCAVEGKPCSTNPLDASAPSGKYTMTDYGMVCSENK